MKPTYLGTLALLAACSSSTSPGGGGGGGGALAISVTAPAGVTAHVLVLGPGGYRHSISTSQTLSALDTGTYTVFAEPGTTSDPIVSIGYAGVVTGSPATLAPGSTANLTATYTSPYAGAGVLWVANASSNRLSGFSSAQLAATGAPVPAVTVGNGSSSGAVPAPGDVAADASGGVWVSSIADTMRYFTAAQVAASGNPTPTRKLTYSAIVSITAVAVDAAGNVWVADQFGNKIYGFSKAQADSGGSLTPAVTISPVLGSIDRPFDILFDRAGDLWVVNYHGNSVAGFTPAQLAVTGSPVPFAAVSNTSGTTAPLGAAFDASGNLWVVSITDTIAKFNASDLTTVGSPTPAVIITGGGLNSPMGAAFDNSGALWVSNYQGNTLLRYTSSQLAASGAPTPAVKISATSSSLAQPSGIVFSPTTP
jgi:sugar lactone lactonase YvrE